MLGRRLGLNYVFILIKIKAFNVAATIRPHRVHDLLLAVDVDEVDDLVFDLIDPLEDELEVVDGLSVVDLHHHIFVSREELRHFG